MVFRRRVAPHFHALDVKLDEIDAGKVEFVERHLADHGGVFRVVDRLANEFVIGAFAQFQAAEARGTK